MGNEVSGFGGGGGEVDQQQMRLGDFDGPDRFRPTVNYGNMNSSGELQSRVIRQNNNDIYINNQRDSQEGINEPIERFRYGYGQKELDRDIKRQEICSQIRLIDQEVIPDKNFIEFPRMTLLSRQQERQYLPTDLHPVMQSTPIEADIIQSTNEFVDKEEEDLIRQEQESRQQTIREQLGRIQYLEDRMEILQKEISNQVFHLNYKKQQSQNFINDYNVLRGETMVYHSRISTLEGETKIKDSTKLEEDLLKQENSIKQKEKDIAELNEQLFYWKERAFVDDNAVNIVANLRDRAQNMMEENAKLKKVLFASEEYLEVKQFMNSTQQTQHQMEILDQAEELLNDFKDPGVEYTSEAYLMQSTTKKAPSYTAAAISETIKKQQKLQIRASSPQY